MCEKKVVLQEEGIKYALYSRADPLGCLRVLAKVGVLLGLQKVPAGGQGLKLPIGARETGCF